MTTGAPEDVALSAPFSNSGNTIGKERTKEGAGNSGYVDLAKFVLAAGRKVFPACTAGN